MIGSLHPQTLEIGSLLELHWRIPHLHLQLWNPEKDLKRKVPMTPVTAERLLAKHLPGLSKYWV